MKQRGNLFRSFGPTGDSERVDPLTAGSSFRLERIVSTGQATPADEWYDQDRDEWVVLLSGSATLRFDDPPESLDLVPGDWMLIPAYRRHRVEKTAAAAETVWLALHFRTQEQDV